MSYLDGKILNDDDYQSAISYLEWLEESSDCDWKLDKSIDIKLKTLEYETRLPSGNTTPVPKTKKEYLNAIDDLFSSDKWKGWNNFHKEGKELTKRVVQDVNPKPDGIDQNIERITSDDDYKWCLRKIEWLDQSKKSAVKEMNRLGLLAASVDFWQDSEGKRLKVLVIDWLTSKEYANMQYDQIKSKDANKKHPDRKKQDTNKNKVRIKRRDIIKVLDTVVLLFVLVSISTIVFLIDPNPLPLKSTYWAFISYFDYHYVIAPLLGNIRRTFTAWFIS